MCRLGKPLSWNASAAATWRCATAPVLKNGPKSRWASRPSPSCAALKTFECWEGSQRVACTQGNRIRDICKTVVKNLPEVTPRVPDTATTQGGTNAFDDADLLRNPQLFAEQVPGGADVIFDCIRVSGCQYSLQRRGDSTPTLQQLLELLSGQ